MITFIKKNINEENWTTIIDIHEELKLSGHEETTYDNMMWQMRREGEVNYRDITIKIENTQRYDFYIESTMRECAYFTGFTLYGVQDGKVKVVKKSVRRAGVISNILSTIGAAIERIDDPYFVVGVDSGGLVYKFTVGDFVSNHGVGNLKDAYSNSLG